MLDFNCQFESVFGSVAASPKTPEEDAIVDQLFMTSYITQRDNGMAAERAAQLLGVDPVIAERLYQEWKS